MISLMSLWGRKDGVVAHSTVRPHRVCVRVDRWRNEMDWNNNQFNRMSSDSWEGHEPRHVTLPNPLKFTTLPRGPPFQICLCAYTRMPLLVFLHHVNHKRKQQTKQDPTQPTNCSADNQRNTNNWIKLSVPPQMRCFRLLQFHLCIRAQWMRATHFHFKRNSVTRNILAGGPTWSVHTYVPTPFNTFAFKHI